MYLAWASGLEYVWDFVSFSLWHHLFYQKFFWLICFIKISLPLYQFVHALLAIA